MFQFRSNILQHVPTLQNPIEQFQMQSEVQRFILVFGHVSKKEPEAKWRYSGYILICGGISKSTQSKKYVLYDSYVFPISYPLMGAVILLINAKDLLAMPRRGCEKPHMDRNSLKLARNVPIPVAPPLQNKVFSVVGICPQQYFVMSHRTCRFGHLFSRMSFSRAEFPSKAGAPHAWLIFYY